MVSDLRSEIKDFWFESGYSVCAEVIAPIARPMSSAYEAGGSGNEELREFSRPSPAVL